MAGRTGTNRKIRCVRHGSCCKVKRDDLTIGGSSCTDYSSAGKRKGTEGKNLGATLALCRRFAESRLGLHENAGALYICI